jgi:phage terminase Nu1 subunit (DNA packaging protein)
LARRGIVVRAGRGTYVVEKSLRRYCSHLRDLVTGRGGESAIASVTVERDRLAKAQADLAEAKGRRLRRELVPAADVESEWSSILRTVRAGMLAVPSRVQQKLPHLTTHDATVIDAEVREVLTEVGQS